MAQQENILGTMPVGRLVFHMSWPIMVSMLVQAVYNLVDSIFVARISDRAFLALSYAYPIQTLMVAFCVGTGVAFSAILSKRLGEGDREGARDAVYHGLAFYAGCWALFFAFGALGAEAYLAACTGDGQVAEMGTVYLRICCCLSVGMCAQFPLERVMQSTGHPAGFMIIQGSGGVINLILDPILIFGFKMGVAGAAAATVIGQITGGLIGCFLVRSLNGQLSLHRRGFHFQRELAAEYVRIAAPAVLMQSMASVTSLGLNAILKLWSETAVWVLGVYFKLQTFVFMPVFSVNNALVSIISYNFGAKERRRVSASAWFGLKLALGTALVGIGVLFLWAGPLLKLCFQAGEEAMAMGVPALRMTALAFPLAAASIILSAPFQSLGYSRFSLAVSALRYVFLPLPAAWILVTVMPQWSFLCFLIGEGIALLAAVGMFLKVKKEKIDSMEGQ